MNIFGAGMYIKQLADKINELIANEVSFGNKLLYAMCVDKEGQEWGNVSRLADKLWLIGRAYTASPERRFTTKEKQPNDYHGDGTGLFFEKVANNIIRAESYKNINILISIFEKTGLVKDDDCFPAMRVYFFEQIMQGRAFYRPARCIGVNKDTDNFVTVIGGELFTENDLSVERIFVESCTPCVNYSVFHKN